MCPEWRMCESLAHAAEIEVGVGVEKLFMTIVKTWNLVDKWTWHLLQQQNYKRTIQMNIYKWGSNWLTKKGNVVTQSHSSLYLPLENLEERKRLGRGGRDTDRNRINQFLLQLWGRCKGEPRPPPLDLPWLAVIDLPCTSLVNWEKIAGGLSMLGYE